MPRVAPPGIQAAVAGAVNAAVAPPGIQAAVAGAVNAAVAPAIAGLNAADTQAIAGLNAAVAQAVGQQVTAQQVDNAGYQYHARKSARAEGKHVPAAEVDEARQVKFIAGDDARM